jgi:peptide chain release factor 1
MLFAGDLVQMYMGYCAQQGLRTELVKLTYSEGVSNELIIEAIIEVETSGAYVLLQGETGVHRVQRVPDTEVKGRVHTSTAVVMVLPSFNEVNEATLDIDDPNSDFYVDAKDVRRDYKRARGAGGQHVNKVETAVRLVHLPTNTTVDMQDERNRASNESKAWKLLRSRLAQQRRGAREAERLKLRRNTLAVGVVGRSDKIRTYNWQQQRVTDHRTGCTVNGIDGIMAGGANLGKLMESVRQWTTEAEIQDLVDSANDLDP